MTGDLLTCEELVLLVTDYFEGTLSPADRARFDEHIMPCPPCQAHLDQMRRTVDVLGQLPQESLSPAVERDLLGAFREWKSSTGWLPGTAARADGSSGASRPGSRPPLPT